jgi:hypothetical protein
MLQSSPAVLLVLVGAQASPVELGDPDPVCRVVMWRFGLPFWIRSGAFPICPDSQQVVDILY